MAEMISLYPSFPGDSEIDTLFKIFQCIGTPTEEIWPGVSALPDYHATFPNWPATSDEKFLSTLHITPAHGLDADGIDLLRRMLTHCPKKRISARQALQHPWFTKDSLHCLTPAARARLEAHAARVAKSATEQAATIKANRRAKEEAEKRKRIEAGEEEEEYDHEEEEFDQDEDVHMDTQEEEELHHEEDEDQDEDGEESAGSANTSLSSTSSE